MSTIVRETQVPAVTERERRARVLEAAALEIEVRGWAQGEAMIDGGQVCLVGAILCAMGERVQPGLLYGPLDVPAKAWGAGYENSDNDPVPMVWNDNEARDVADVTFLLRWRAEEIRDGR